MANLRDIRRRIAGIRNTSKITQAMKMVASAKLRRAQDAIMAARPYANAMAGLVHHLMPRIDRSAMPLLRERASIDRILVVVVTADRGLCGAFNSNIIKQAVSRITGTHADWYSTGRLELLCIGRKGHQFFSKRRYTVRDSHLGIFSDMSYAMAKGIVDGIVAGYMRGEYDQVDIIYNEFKSLVQQHVVVDQMFPIPSDATPTVSIAGKTFHEFIDYIYEPSESALLEQLIPQHLAMQLWRALLESNAAEQAARRTAMDAATSNANDLIDSLKLVYNSARQSSITKEILEVVSGANAMKAS